MHPNPDRTRRHPKPSTMIAICGWAVAAVCLTSLALQGNCRSAQAAALLVTHDLAIELVPAAHILMGHDRMSIRVDDRYKLTRRKKA